MFTYWVYITINQVTFLWFQDKVITTKRNNSWHSITSRYLSQSIRVQSTTCDHILTVNGRLYTDIDRRIKIARMVCSIVESNEYVLSHAQWMIQFMQLLEWSCEKEKNSKIRFELITSALLVLWSIKGLFIINIIGGAGKKWGVDACFFNTFWGGTLHFPNFIEGEASFSMTFHSSTPRTCLKIGLMIP